VLGMGGPRKRGRVDKAAARQWAQGRCQGGHNGPPRHAPRPHGRAKGQRPRHRRGD
jgi:hypothetical protein